jgi:hypothetical protein
MSDDKRQKIIDWICDDYITNIKEKEWSQESWYYVIEKAFDLYNKTLPELKEKYPINFDTLVLDCEGAFYYILMDYPEILHGINLIIMENDYHSIDHKKYIGIYAPGLRSLLTSQIRTFTSLFQSANYDRVAKRELSNEEKDPWWTLLSFYSSLFDLGSARSILSIDMEGELKKYKDTFGIENKNIRPLPDSNEVLELTAAQKDSVEENLQRLSFSKNQLSDNKFKAVDICLSSSVIEVGVDISRV